MFVKWVEILTLSIASLFFFNIFIEYPEFNSWKNTVNYTNKLNGKKIILTRKPDEFVAKFSSSQENITEEKSLDVEPELSTIHSSRNSNQNFGVYRVNSEHFRITETLQNQDVEGIIPVYVDSEGRKRYIIPNQITVQFKENITEARQLFLIQSHNTSILKKQLRPGFYSLSVPEKQDIFEKINEFNELDEVIFSAPYYVGFNNALYIPNDTRFNEQWALRNIGQTDGQIGVDVKATNAWDITKGNPDIVIAIIDSGVALKHPDLKSNIVERPPGEDWDFADHNSNNNGLSPDHYDNHGTQCAGIAAAIDNGTGVVGIAPGCSILPIRINLYSSDYQDWNDALYFVTSIKDRFTKLVINCSWKVSGGDYESIQLGINDALDQDIIVCCAAGNSNQNLDINPIYPASYQGVITVAATDHRDYKSSISNFGTTVDVSAPGVDILSTIPYRDSIDSKYGKGSGTSMATPFVSGLAALIWSKNPNLTSLQVRQIIKNNCDNIDSKNPDYATKLGSGRINALQSLQNTPI